MKMKMLNKFISILLFVFILTLAFGGRANALSWDVVMNDGFGEGGQNRTINSLVVFGDYIYAGVNNLDDGAKVFRSNDGTNWTQVNANGFGNPAHTNVTLFSDNDTLYAGTAGEVGVSGFKLLKSNNGTTWMQIGEDGFGDVDNYAITSIALFNGKLYISVLYIDLVTFNTGMRVYRIDSDSSWTKVNEEGFGDSNNITSYAMSVFNNKLYVGTNHLVQGPEMWRTQNGTSWSQVADNGFGETNGRFFSSIFNFHDKIYASMMSDTGFELWRSDSGNVDTWTQIGEDGFGSADNLWTSYLPVIVNDIIYLGTGNETVDIAKIFFSNDGENWTEEDNGVFVDARDEGIWSGTLFKNRIYFAIRNGDIGARIIRSEELDSIKITTESNDLPEATKERYYSFQLEYENGTSPYSCTWEGDLPSGMEVTTDCKIQGTPQNASNHTFTVYLQDSGIPFQTDEKEFTLKVNENEFSSGNEAEISELPETGKADIVLIITFLCQIALLTIGLMFLLKTTQKQKKDPK